MAERMIGLSIDTIFNENHNHPKIPEFIEGFSGALHSGDGRKPQVLESLGVDTDFPLRLLVGIPKKDLSREQRLLAEAYASWFFGTPMGKQSHIWTTRPGWLPTNPGRIDAPIQESRLDVDWMLSLGIGKTVWERLILASPDALARAEKHSTSKSTLRQLLTLSVYGFSDPHQFFTSDKVK